MESAGGVWEAMFSEVNLILLGTREAFMNWCVTTFPSPIPGRVSHLQLPVVGSRAGHRANPKPVILSPHGEPAQLLELLPASYGLELCTALFNSSGFILMTFKVVCCSRLSILLIFFYYLIIHVSVPVPQAGARTALCKPQWPTHCSTRL